MAEQKVVVGVAQSDEDGTNRIKIWVHPWTVETQQGDTVVWEPDSTGNQILRLKITKKNPLAMWPFAGRSTLAKKRPRTGARKQVMRKKRLPYNIDIVFVDAKRKRRTATIDPDMIIET